MSCRRREKIEVGEYKVIDYGGVYTCMTSLSSLSSMSSELLEEALMDSESEREKCYMHVSTTTTYTTTSNTHPS